LERPALDFGSRAFGARNALRFVGAAGAERTSPSP
jgi:hypothetical protein